MLLCVLCGRPFDSSTDETRISQGPPSRRVDEDTLKRWMNVEIRQSNRSTVTRGRPLNELLSEDEPQAEARDGSVHAFDPDTLERLAEELSPIARMDLRLPITFYLTHKVSDDCYVAEDGAIEALTQLDVAKSDPRKGKLWMGTALARSFAREWPTVAQFVLV